MERERTVERKKKFIEAFTKSLGNISVACKNVNINRLTYYNWLKKDKEFKEKVDEVRESQIDFVESKLIKKINDDDLGAIIFFLKTKAKRRGYSERADVEVNINSENVEKVEVSKVLTEEEAREECLKLGVPMEALLS